MPLSAKLEDQQSLQRFIHGKTDRQIAVASLTIIDEHVRECSERWNRIAKYMRICGGCLLLLVMDRLFVETPIASGVHKLLAWAFGVL